jgi:hypothetical protein
MSVIPLLVLTCGIAAKMSCCSYSTYVHICTVVRERERKKDKLVAEMVWHCEVGAGGPGGRGMAWGGGGGEKICTEGQPFSDSGEITPDTLLYCSLPSRDTIIQSGGRKLFCLHRKARGGWFFAWGFFVFIGKKFTFTLITIIFVIFMSNNKDKKYCKFHFRGIAEVSYKVYLIPLRAIEP